MREWRSEVMEGEIAAYTPGLERRELVTAPASDAGFFAGSATSRGSTVNARILRAMIRDKGPRAKQGLLHLQRTYGNRYTQRVLSLARSGSAEEEVSPEVESEIENARGGGRSLGSAVRSQMEPAFGADFGGVRVHTDRRSDVLNKAVGAVAFTTGQDIFFSQDAYAPQSSEGRGLLAHELTHVVQQGAGVQSKLELSDPGDASEQEATRVGNLVAQTPTHVQPQCACGGTCEKCSTAQPDAVSRANGSEGAIRRQADAGNVTSPQAPQTEDSTATGPAPVPPGGCPSPAKANPDPRVIQDNLCLLSQGLTGEDRLNDAFHNNPPLTAKDNGTEAVRKFQQALVDVNQPPDVHKVLPEFGVDGKWGGETSKAVASFQGKNGIPVSNGGEAGRKTLLALDAHLQQNPPKPKPPEPTPPEPTPSQAKVDAKCGEDPQSGKAVVLVTGVGFPPGSEVDLIVDGAGGNAALADNDKKFSGSVPADLKDGSHVVKAKSGSVEGSAQFSTPCGKSPQPPTPVNPGLVTQDELLVLTKYQFKGETEREAIEDAVRDLKGKLDPTPVSWDRTLLEGICETAVQFTYGAFEQVIRTAVKNLFPQPQEGKEDAGTIVDNAHDKASDLLEDFGKDAIKDAFKEEDQKPTKALEEQLEIFRRDQLKGLRKGYLQLETDWIAKVQADPETANITPAELQGLGKALDETSDKMYTIRYSQTLEGWDSFIARKKLGTTGALVPGKHGAPEVIDVTDLSSVDHKDPKDVPGVLLIGIEANDGGSLQSSEKLSEAGDVKVTRQMVALNDIHIFGLSDEVRNHLEGKVGSLNFLMVLRGNPADGGRVAIGKNEAGRLVDGGSDSKGTKWLGDVSKVLGGSGDAQDGMQRLFDRDLSSNTLVPGSVKGP